MGNKKRNRILVRCAVAAGTLAAGLGIWSSVLSHSQVAQIAQPTPAAITSSYSLNPNFSSSDNFLNLPNNQTGQSTGIQSNPVQQNPVQPTPAPRFRTRGS